MRVLGLLGYNLSHVVGNGDGALATRRPEPVKIFDRLDNFLENGKNRYRN
jgi:hypothetical protein